MYRIPTLFLETTVFNFFFDGKQGQKRRDTIALFNEVQKGNYEVFSSEAIVNELRRAKKEKFEKMKALIAKYSIKAFIADDATDALAAKYIEYGIIPPEYPDDANHIAMATTHQMDFLVSYNMGHIIKQKTMIGTGFIALDNYYSHVLLCTPTEVIEYDKGRTSRRTGN